jgi:bacterioferritin-associated ferredoxin
MNVSFCIVPPYPMGTPAGAKAERRVIICECTGTTDGTVRALARDGVTKVAEVTRRCGAGGCCQSCRPTIARILRETARAEARTETAPTLDAGLEPVTA